MTHVSVAWGMPSYGPVWAPAYETHMRAIARASRHLAVEHLGGIGGIGISDRMPLDAAENIICEQFLALPDATHLFLTELDMLLPDDTIERLLAVNKDIVSGLYFLRGGHGQPCLFKKFFDLPAAPYQQTPVSLFPRTEPFKLNGCAGVGCVLIQRHVLETMERPWWSMQPGKHGSDMFFYTHAVKAGFEVWVDPGVSCGQIEYVTWGVHHYAQRLRDDPSFASQGAIIGSAAIAAQRA